MNREKCIKNASKVFSGMVDSSNTVRLWADEWVDNMETSLMREGEKWVQLTAPHRNENFFDGRT